MDENFRRLQYVRYADDFLIGIIGAKEDAQAVKQEIGTYIAGQLKLELSDEKTLVTKATDRAKFLGFEIRVTPQSNHTKRTKSGATARNFSGHVMLEVPTSAIQKKLLELGAMRIDVRNGTEIWQPTYRGKLVGRTDLSILDQYNGEIRGFCNYYAIANNRSKLHKFRYIMEYSFYKTLACKYRTTKRRIIAQYRIGKDIGVKFQDKHGNERIRLLWKGSLARDPYPLGKEADIIHKPKGILKKPSLGARLKANRCEWCGKETSALVMHQVRTLKELDESKPWAAFMKKINRKTLVSVKAVTLKFTVRTVNEWRAGYSESCKSGSGASVRKPTAAMRQGAGYLAYFARLRWMARGNSETYGVREKWLRPSGTSFVNSIVFLSSGSPLIRASHMINGWEKRPGSPNAISCA